MDPTLVYWPLVLLHVLAFALWLGGDIGVYVTSRYVVRADLALAERLRFLDALLAIDIVPRTGIVLLPVLGLQIAALRGAIAPPAWLQALFWLGGAAWLGLVWASYRLRGTARGERVQRLDVRLRLLLIPLLAGTGTWSLVATGPVVERWLATKFLSYAALLVIGLYLRTVIASWVTGFGLLRAGRDEEGNRHIAAGFARGNRVARVYWVVIAFTAWLGLSKPF